MTGSLEIPGLGAEKWLIVVLFCLGSVSASGQAVWLDDASEAQIPAALVSGRINGKSVTFTSGTIGRSGFSAAVAGAWAVGVACADSDAGGSRNAAVRTTVRWRILLGN